MRKFKNIGTAVIFCMMGLYCFSQELGSDGAVKHKHDSSFTSLSSKNATISHTAVYNGEGELLLSYDSATVPIDSLAEGTYIVESAIKQQHCTVKRRVKIKK